MTTLRRPALAALTLLAGCTLLNPKAQDADLSDPALVERFSAASAPNVYLLGYLPVMLVDISALDGGSDCPVVTEDGDTRTIEGGCTDADGRVWSGRAVVTGDSVTYDSLGVTEDAEGCEGQDALTYDGEMTVEEASGAFTVALDVDNHYLDASQGCATVREAIALDYDGVVVQDADDVMTWSGSGTLASSEDGRVDAVTTDEVLDQEACSYEAMSGATTLSAGAHEVVITYDGATACDEAASASWSLDGVDQGQLAGIGCAATPRRAGLALALAGLLLGLARRRR